MNTTHPTHGHASDGDRHPLDFTSGQAPVAAYGRQVLRSLSRRARGGVAVIQCASQFLMTLALFCALMGVMAFAGASAQARTLHKYESQITEIPAGPGVEAPGKLVEAEGAMTVNGGDLYVTERPGVQVTPNNFRADEFSSPVPGMAPEFVSQLPQPALSGIKELNRGIAFGTSTGETEMYLGQNEDAGNTVAVFGVGLCGTLECASFQKSWTGADTPHGSFGGVGDVAVDDSTGPEDWAHGDVFVLDNDGREAGVAKVIDVLKPEVGGSEKYEMQLTGISPSTPFTDPGDIVVSGFNGDVVVHDGSAIDVFKPLEPAKVGEKGTYSFVGELTSPSGKPHEVSGVAVDADNGEIYVTTPTAVLEFSAEGVFLGDFTGEGTPERAWSFESHAPRGLAVDPVSHRVFVGVETSSVDSAVVDVFGPDVVIPDVTTGPVTNVEVESGAHTWGVGLTGTVDPDMAGEASCVFVWGTSPSFGNSTPCSEEVAEGGSAVPVHASLSGLLPDTTYYYRLQAKNANGLNTGEESQDEHFTTPGPGLRGESVSEVSSSSVRLEATIDPHEASTSYRFEYDTSAYAPGEASHGVSIPMAGATVGSGKEDVEVSQHVQGLSAHTEYHYRVVASSEVEVAPGQVRSEEFDGPDQVFVTQRTGGPLVLPDGRAWELVSPVDKRGGLIQALGYLGVEQASVSGDAFTYLTTAPSEPEPQGNGSSASQVLSSRAAGGGWSSVDITMPRGAPGVPVVGQGEEYRFFSEDLSMSITEPFGPFSEPESEIAGERVVEAFPEATERTSYLRHNATCQTAPATCYEPLLTSTSEFADVPEGIEFGGDQKATDAADAQFVGVTPDAGHVVLQSGVALTSTPAPEGGVYEWSAARPATERLQLVSILPEIEGGKAASGAVFGEQVPAIIRTVHAISDNGSRIIFTANGELYMRDTVKGETIRLGDRGVFQTASADDSRIFFTEGHAGVAGADLSECAIVEVEEAGRERLMCDLSDLTPVPASGQPGAGEAAEVRGGVLGVSEDGGYVYFVANGVQAAGGSPGDCQEATGGPVGATCNLYVSHDGETSWVATLSDDDNPDWDSVSSLSTSRVSPDGVWLAFMSDRSLTGYDNRDAVSGMPDEEVYLYDAVSGRLVCASCDPTGARPTGVQIPSVGDTLTDTEGWRKRWLAANVPDWTLYRLDSAVYQSRYLSDEGRLFFNSSDALVSQDTNGEEDVYEYEPVGVGGSGGCSASLSTFNERVGGCVGLISSGVAVGESAFLDASANGGDVFFLTQGRLVGDDVDTSLDVYDAHQCTASAPCAPRSEPGPPECRSAAACRVAPAAQPSIYGAPSSATFSGAGNVVAPPPPPAVSKAAVKVKSLTRAQELAKALKACAKKARGKRVGCEKQARKKYGAAKAKGSANTNRGVK